MNPKKYRYIFGPVPSRRLGYSLGIDVIPLKTCSYDCIYCQLGKTTNKTTERKDFVPYKEVVNELKLKLDEDTQIDYITLSGSGEPTLYSSLDKLISEIKSITNIPVAVLTNGSLLWNKDVQKSLMKADLIIPSLDAGKENIFRYVNRPHKSLSFEKVVEGMIKFSSKYANKIWTEVFLLNGVTSIQAEALSINSILKKIKPAKIQLNTVKRPPAESFAFPVPEEQMNKLVNYFDGNVEIIPDFNKTADKKHLPVPKNEIIYLLKRRPCSLDDISKGLNLNKNEVIKYLEQLIKRKKIITHNHNRIIYYSIK